MIKPINGQLPVLNKEQFDILVQTDFSLTIHPGNVIHYRLIDDEDMMFFRPCIMCSSLLRNFLVPVEILDRHYPYSENTFQFLNEQQWLSNYSKNSFDFLTLEMSEINFRNRLNCESHGFNSIIQLSKKTKNENR